MREKFMFYSVWLNYFLSCIPYRVEVLLLELSQSAHAARGGPKVLISTEKSLSRRTGQYVLFPLSLTYCFWVFRK